MIRCLIEESRFLGGGFEQLLVLIVDVIAELDGLIFRHPRREIDPGYRKFLCQMDILALAGGNGGGLAGFELVAWQGVVAPAGVPREIIDALAAQISKVVADSATRDKLTAIALEPLAGSTPDSFAAYVKTEVGRWADIVRTSGAELE
jgi:Tripartite tricarboxylate transporter family receptor